MKHGGSNPFPTIMGVVILDIPGGWEVGFE